MSQPTDNISSLHYLLSHFSSIVWLYELQKCSALVYQLAVQIYQDEKKREKKKKHPQKPLSVKCGCAPRGFRFCPWDFAPWPCPRGESPVSLGRGWPRSQWPDLRPASGFQSSQRLQAQLLPLGEKESGVGEGSAQPLWTGQLDTWALRECWGLPGGRWCDHCQFSAKVPAWELRTASPPILAIRRPPLEGLRWTALGRVARSCVRQPASLVQKPRLVWL